MNSNSKSQPRDIHQYLQDLEQSLVRIEKAVLTFTKVESETRSRTLRRHLRGVTKRLTQDYSIINERLADVQLKLLERSLSESEKQQIRLYYEQQQHSVGRSH